SDVYEPTDPSAISNVVQVGRKVNMFCLYIKSTVTSTFQLQCAHVGSYTSEGVFPDPDTAPFVWHNMWYLGTSGSGNSTQIVVGGTGAFAIASLVPDFEPDWVRLFRTDAGA